MIFQHPEPLKKVRIKCDYVGRKRCQRVGVAELYPTKKDAGWSYLCNAHFAMFRLQEKDIVFNFR